MANSVNPDETAHNEPYHQEIHCLLKNICWSAGLNGLIRRWGLNVNLKCVCKTLCPNYSPFNIFWKVVFCKALKSKEVNYQMFVMIQWF